MKIYDIKFARDVSQGLVYKYWWDVLPIKIENQLVGVQGPWGYERFGR